MAQRWPRRGPTTRAVRASTAYAQGFVGFGPHTWIDDAGRARLAPLPLVPVRLRVVVRGRERSEVVPSSAASVVLRLPP